MISVRKEWLNVTTDEQKLEWVNKWGDLLMETQLNPIWTSGHTEAIKQITEQVQQIRDGEYPDLIHPMVQEYADALEMINKGFKVVNFTLSGDGELMFRLDEDQLRQYAAEEMAKVLSKHVSVDIDEKDDGTVELNFNIVMMED
tara:strand:- start:16982 stop:17413 length:432 start_codon:yes stop_codon:yes gene_type:complete